MYSQDKQVFHAERLAQLGQQQLQAGNAEAAVELLRKAISLEPNVGRYHGLMALALIDLKRYHAAEHEAKLALQLEPDLFALLALGLSQLAVGRYESAVQLLLQCLREEPDNPTILASLASAYLGLRRYRDSEMAAQRALSIEPQNPLATQALAYSLWYQGRYAEAESLALQGLAQNPEDDIMHTIKGLAELRRKNSGAAIAHSLNALAVNPDNTDAKRLLLLAYAQQRLWMRPVVRLALWCARFTAFTRTAIGIGTYTLVNLLTHALQSHSTHAPHLQVLASCLVGVYVLAMVYLIAAPRIFNAMVGRAREAWIREAGKQVRL